MAALLTAAPAGTHHSITLDWLAFTFREDSKHAGEWLHKYASTKGSVEATATNGYRTAYKSSQGVLSMWDVDRAEMGYHVVLAGSTIRNVCEHYQLEQKALLASVCDAGGSITRLDLAKDLTGEYVSLDNIYQAMEHREYHDTARKFAQIHSIGGGNTIYVGSRQSEKFIRIYDKAAESNLSDSLWFRFEVELKGMVARACSNLLVGPANWNSVWETIVQHMVSMGNSMDYSRFFSAGEVPIGIPKLEKKTDREKWIETQVMPAVVKHFIEHRESKAVALLRSMLDRIEGQAGMVDTVE